MCNAVLLRLAPIKVPETHRLAPKSGVSAHVVTKAQPLFVFTPGSGAIQTLVQKIKQPTNFTDRFCDSTVAMSTSS